MVIMQELDINSGTELCAMGSEVVAGHTQGVSMLRL